MIKRDFILLPFGFALSVMLLAMIHFTGDPVWLKSLLPNVPGGDGILWQVQTTFLSVGFAGLAIATQLFAEAPLAIGISRSRVLQYIHAGRFVGVGLAANIVIAIEVIWLPSATGVIGVSILGFLPTVILLVLSMVRLMQLFGHPSRLDEVVRVSLVDSLSNRLAESTRQHANARKQLDGLFASDLSLRPMKNPIYTLKVPVPEGSRVVKLIRPKTVRNAIDSLSLLATEANRNFAEVAEEYVQPHVTLDVEPGDRTRLGETLFRVITSKELDEATTRRVIRLLQSSIVFEPSGSVTTFEESDREIANLKDAIGRCLRSGELATAERALVLLGHVVRGVWMAEPEFLRVSRRASFVRRDWLFRSIGEVEQDALLSPRVANIFVSAAMTRALEAPRTGSDEYMDECLRSFTRIWFDVLRYSAPEFSSVTSRITTCVQNLAAFSHARSDEQGDYEARATWAMVELVKLGLDSKDFGAAKMAAQELNSLFKSSRQGILQSHVRAGLLVLSGWIGYLKGKQDAGYPVDPSLREMLMPTGTRSEILAARVMLEQGATSFSRYDWWEIETVASYSVQVRQLSGYIDRAQLEALISASGALPPAKDQESASRYRNILGLLTEADRELSATELFLKKELTDKIALWDTIERGRLSQEPLSDARIESVRSSLRQTLSERRRLADEIPLCNKVPETTRTSRPILGMNFRVPKIYLVDKVFNQTYANPEDFGHLISQGFSDGEDQRIIRELRSLQHQVLEPKASAILQHIEDLGDDAQHFVMVTPYGGLEDIHEWYSNEFMSALDRVTYIETGVLESEAYLFDRRGTLLSCRRPEEKEGLFPVKDTYIALGVFEDVQGKDEPEVRIETGEYFLVWPGDAPRVFRFGMEIANPDDGEGDTA